MTSEAKYFVFIYPKAGPTADLINLAVFLMSPRERWPAHVTVAGPFDRKPRSRANPNFEMTMFSLGAWNFFRDGLCTVYLKVGMQNLWSYWKKPDFLGDPVPHLSIYNGRDPDVARRLFRTIEPLRLLFGFGVHGIEVVDSTAQRRFDLRHKVNPRALASTAHMNIDELAALPIEERIELTAEALAMCKSQSLIEPTPRY